MLFRKLCWMGAVGFLSYNLSRFPVIPLYAQNLGVRPELIGFVVAASTITGIPGKILFGTLSDHWGRRRLLIASMMVCSLVPFFYVFLSPGYVLLLAIRFCHGLATAILGPVSRAVVADLSKENERGTKLGIYTGANMVGTTIAPMLGGWLLYHFGFRGPFLVSGIAGMIGLAIAFQWPKDHPSNPPHPFDPSTKVRFFDGVRYVLKQPSLRATGVVEASKFFATGAIEAFLPIYASTVAHLNETQIGVLFGVQVLGTLLTKPIMGWLSDRIGRRPLIIGGLFVAASLVWLIPHTQVFHLLMTIAGIYGVAAAAVTVSTAAFVTDLASRSDSASRGGFET
ncbi:MAG: MFS transporter, partial [Candidatus Omnitrophica bacterium]|nr:MFS transporter [Candidatus Omnitrophota bacterium]